MLQLAIDASSAAASLLITDFKDDPGVVSAEAKDIKTTADEAAQAAIIRILRSGSDFPIVAEEGVGGSSYPVEPCWFVDPLDGTYNFHRGLPVAAVSIALWQDRSPLLGVVYDLYTGDLYTGIHGEGAWWNEQEIRVSGVEDISQAALATGFPSGRSYETKALLSFVESVQKYKKIRMLGSASMMLTHLAAGRVDVYEEEDIYLWDVAAGLALVSAAGGVFTLREGAGPLQYHVRASNRCLGV